MKPRFICFHSAVLLLATCLFAQTDPLAQANADLQAKDYAKAESAFAAVTAKDPQNKQAWFGLGQAKQEQGKHKEALDAFAKAEGLTGATAARILFREARSNAALGDKDKAFDLLNKAVAAGFAQAAILESTAEFAAMKPDTRWHKLLETMDATSRPCMHDPRYRGFDFWAGEWEVRPSGQPGAVPSHSSIQRILEDCVIFENFTSSNGVYKGKSFNIFDANTGQWRQTYVDSTGSLLNWDGEVRDNVMYFLGVNYNAQGQKAWDRLTYFHLANGHVRHLWEQSTDGGKNWTVLFDGDYTPVGAATASK